VPEYDDAPALDRLIHGPAHLAIMTVLSSVRSVDTGTSSNASSNASKELSRAPFRRGHAGVRAATRGPLAGASRVSRSRPPAGPPG
jgi:hypothetical protein